MNPVQTITMNETTIQKVKSINNLLLLANKNCGGSKVAAEVLLCAYNIYSYKLDIGGLCLLDPTYYLAALEVIDLRCRHGIEPHTLIIDGDEVFKQLATDWQHLHNETIH